MPGPPSATSDHHETLSGKFDFIDQRDEFVSHSEPTHRVFDPLAEDHAVVEEAWTKNESLTTEGAADLQRGNAIASTVPPPNDLRDTHLYSGNRSVIFVGTRSYQL